MRRYLVLFLFLFSFAVLPTWALAYKSNICAEGKATCDATEVGRFMKGISTDCGNQGNCSLEDIMIVVVDIGEFVLGMVGVLVLLMYVLGGFWILTSRGNTGWVTKGKNYLTVSTIGLLIVMFAYMGIKFLLFVLAPSYQAGFLSICIAGNADAGGNDGIECRKADPKIKGDVAWTCQSGVCLPPAPVVPKP